VAHENIEVSPGKKKGHVVDADGTERKVPAGWALLPPGDAALSRRIKKDGPTWTVKEKKGRKMFSRGIWAPAERIEFLKQQLVAERADPAYEKKLEAGRQRRAKEEASYREEFLGAVYVFLAFADDFADLAVDLAQRVTEHAIPVGSGTVARTKRIPIEQRAESAVIAWMRHQTTAYDNMTIPRVKGKRREIRRMLAQRSRAILEKYRDGLVDDVASCPLYQVLNS